MWEGLDVVPMSGKAGGVRLFWEFSYAEDAPLKFKSIFMFSFTTYIFMYIYTYILDSGCRRHD